MKAKLFEFTKYKFSPREKRIDFYYTITFLNGSSKIFVEKIGLPRKIVVERKNKEVVKDILDSLHIVLGVSYYKLYCPKRIVIKDNRLSKDQADFWNNVYKKGLGEFFYRNKIKFDQLARFPYIQRKEKKKPSVELKNRSLVGIGGGKDSALAAELLRKDNHKIIGFDIQSGNESKIVASVIKKSNIGVMSVKRKLDGKLFKENKLQDTYNGHVPVSAVYSFLGLLAGVLYDYKYFIVGNEHSSNFGNVKYGGMVVNHQWSKSGEYEELFNNYVEKYIASGFKYFSILRPFHEIRIAKMFANYNKYFKTFSSCNRSFKVKEKRCESLWCGECPKCVFVFLMFSPFVDKKDLFNIFGKNLFEDESLLGTFKDILGIGVMKPFDCVGTFREARVSFSLAREKFKNDFIIRGLINKVKVSNDDIEEVFKTAPSPNIPTDFKFVGTESALILGYGKEGKVTEAYIKKHYPNIRIAIADVEKDGKRYLERQANYDLILKTPGIPKERIERNYTTATNIFLSRVKNNKVIGITGTKGKSTTASLVAHILKKSGKRVRLLGNIGKPMLEQLDNIKKDEIIVLELSSYQLDDIQYSPDVAVVLNLYLEHLNYHGGLSNYYMAKKNIIKYANNSDVFIFSSKFPELKKWSGETKAKSFDYSNFSLGSVKPSITGKHNFENIKAALLVVKQFGIKEKDSLTLIEDFQPLKHRMEYLGEFKGINFYDDSISTTPESTIAAINSISKIETLFLGGEDRGYDFIDLEKKIRQKRIKNLVLFPETGHRIIKNEIGLNILRTRSMKKAVDFAYKNTKSGKVCLLSSASPSYSLWKNFEEKGNEFKNEIFEQAKR